MHLRLYLSLSFVQDLVGKLDSLPRRHSYMEWMAQFSQNFNVQNNRYVFCLTNICLNLIK